MRLDGAKGRVSHLGCDRPEWSDGLGEERPETCPAEKDLAMWVDSRLSVSRRRARAAEKAHGVLA